MFVPDFRLVVKYIFNEEKSQKSIRSFINKQDKRPRAIHVEVREEQALEVTSAIKKIIKTSEF